MTPTRRAAVLALLALLAGVALAGAGIVAAVDVAITEVRVSPEQPQTGELVTFSIDVQNADSSDEAFRIDTVTLREASGSTVYARATDLGNVPPGSTLTVPLTTTFESTGVKDLRVVLTGATSAGGEVRRSPVTVVVNDRGTQLALEVDDPVVGERTQLDVTVSNGGSTAIRQLDLRLSGEGLRVDQPRRLLASLGAETDRTFAFNVTFTGSGDRTVEAALDYSTASGQTRTVTRRESVAVDPLREDAALDAAVGTGGGSTPPIVAEVTNLGNARLEDGVLRVTDGETVVARRPTADVPAGASRSFSVNVSGVERADLDVTFAYATGDRDGSVTDAVRYVAQPGRIELTGVDTDTSGGVMTITGSASNVGLTAVDSVVVAVQPAEGVTPTAPNREFFVGTVPPSDFVSFDLTARVDAGVESVPVSVTYLADSAERSQTVSVPVGDAAPARTPSDGGGGGLLLPAVLGVVVLVGIGAVVYLGWRNRRGG